MKKTIIFVLLLALISALGVMGTGITDKLIGDSSIEQAELPRSSVKSDAVYIEPGSEISFDPMKLVDKENSVLLCKQYDNGYSEYDSALRTEEIIGMIVKALSCYSYDTAFDLKLYDRLSEEIRITENRRYYFIDHFAYTNMRGRKRFVDLIMTVSDLDIIYVNFYSDETSELSEEERKAGIERLKKLSADNYNAIGKSTYSSVDFPYIDYPVNSEVMSGDIASNLDVFIDDAYYSLEFNSNVSPVKRFMSLFRKISYFTFSRYDNSYYQSVRSINRFFDALISCVLNNIDPYTSAEYVCVGDKIYQTIHFEGNYGIDSAVIIYNIAEDVVEGYLAPFTDKVW